MRATAVALALLSAHGAAQTEGRTYRDSNPAVSPDGRRVAFYSDRDGDDNEYLLDLESGEIRRLTHSPLGEYGPGRLGDGSRRARSPQEADVHPHDYYTSWSPDGRWVAFFSGPDYDHFDAYKVEIETGRVERLTAGMGAGKVSFAPDGSFIVFGADHADGARLYRAGPDGSDPHLLLP